jgi:hypothetical protein
MRTTLTLDEDVAAKLKAEVRRRGLSFKEVVNETLRAGLETHRESAQVAPFKVKARALGRKPGLDYDNIGELLERLEGPSHR